jgi:hypothetical protein
MRKLAEACEAITATTKKLQKTVIVADYLKSRTVDEAALSAVFLSGRAFPAWEETTLQVGSSLLQPDPQVAGHDLHDVLGFDRRRPRQQIANQHRLGCGPARRCNLPESRPHFENA